MKLTFGEVETFISDLARSEIFYRDILGLDLKQKGDGWLIFDISGIEFALMGGAKKLNKSSYGKDCTTLLCLKSKNIEEDYKHLKSQGVKFLSEIQIVPQGKFATFQDPDGNLLELIQN